MWTSARTPWIIFFICLAPCGTFAGDQVLSALLDEAMRNNPEILVSQANIEAAEYRIPQSTSLPDPMFMVGYQNEGSSRYTYGEEGGAQWMFSASQAFPFPGKLGLKGAMAESDLEGLKAMHEVLKNQTAARVKELYYDLFLAYKNIDLTTEKTELFRRIEDLALSRYATGRAMQEEVLMAQTEKYMIMEKEEMFRQKIRSLEAMFGAVLGREETVSMERPIDPVYRPFIYMDDETLNIALENSPEIRSINRMLEAGGYKVIMAEKEYYPDFTVTTQYSNRGGDFMDMWKAEVSIRIPLYYKTKQSAAVSEARASVKQTEKELESARLMISASVQDSLSMIRSSERLMEIYRDGLIPKNAQGVESALAGYATGDTEMITVISLSKDLLEYEFLYWAQFVQREKSIAILEAVMGVPATGPGGEE